MPWFSVRTIFRHEHLSSDSAVFEERVVLYCANGLAEVHARATADADLYLELNKKFVRVNAMSVFSLGRDEGDLDGVEVWSHLVRGPSDPSEFYRAKYEAYDLIDE